MPVPPSRENYLRPFNSLFFSPFSVLLNKWEKLLVKIGANIQHTEVYESLKNDIVSLRLDLTKVLEDKEDAEDDQGGIFWVSWKKNWSSFVKYQIKVKATFHI